MQFFLKGVSAAVLAAAASVAPLAMAKASPAALSGNNDALSEAESADTRIHPVRGFLPDLRFTLTGNKGETVTEEAFEGKIVLLFFGYASCPDICPTTMAQLSQALALLGEDADKARIVFVSVDPHRDTPEKLQAYVNLFDSNAVGLTGTEKQVADVARRYRVAYQIEKPPANQPDTYEVAHARGIYIFDQQGRARLLASDGNSVENLAESIRGLL